MTSPENTRTVYETLAPEHKGLIAALDRAIPPVIVRSPTDIRDPLAMAFEAGRRSVVDELIENINRKANE